MSISRRSLMAAAVVATADPTGHLRPRSAQAGAPPARNLAVANVSDYAALRVYSGPAKKFQIGAESDGIAGTFAMSDSDFSSADNGGTIIVIVSGPNEGRRIKRVYEGPVDVRWFEVKGDDATNNTAAYTRMAAGLPDGSEIHWGRGTFIGRFKSIGKAFKLVGNGATLKTDDVRNFSDAIISMQGSIAAPAPLEVAPSFGNTSLSGTRGLVGGDLVQLYSGTRRSSDGEAVNHEIVRMLDSSGRVEGQIYSDQTGGKPTYSRITPIHQPEVDGFTFSLGDTPGTAASGSAVFIRYAQEVVIGHVVALGGKKSTIRIDASHRVLIRSAERARPYDTGSGNGYHVALNGCTRVKAGYVKGVGCRHTFDADSCYLVDVQTIVSQDAASSDVPMTHNGYGGYHVYHDVQVVRPSNYAIHTSAQGIAESDLGRQVARSLKIKRLHVDRPAPQRGATPSVYFQYACTDVEVNGVIRNAECGSFRDQMAVRFAGPVGGTSLVDVVVENHDWGVYFDNAIDSSTSFPRSGEWVMVRIVARNVKCIVFDNTKASCYLNLVLENPVSQVDAASCSTGLDAYLRISRAHKGNTQVFLPSNVDIADKDRLIKNAHGHAVDLKSGTSGGFPTLPRWRP